MGRPSKEYENFVKLTNQLLAVPKDVIHERHKAHKEKSAQNPRKRGPKPKSTRRDDHGDSHH